MLKEKRRRTETRRIQQSTLSLLMHYSHQTKKFPTRESQQQTLSNTNTYNPITPNLSTNIYNPMTLNLTNYKQQRPPSTTLALVIGPNHLLLCRANTSRSTNLHMLLDCRVLPRVRACALGINSISILLAISALFIIRGKSFPFQLVNGLLCLPSTRGLLG